MGFVRVMTQNYYFSANQNAKRLHGVPPPTGWFLTDVQSPRHRVSHTMTNKNKNKNANKQQRNSGSGDNLGPKSRQLAVFRPPVEPSVRAQLSTSKKAPIPQFLLAQLRPFDVRAFGVKVPDEATFPSSVADSRDIFTLSTTAIGGAGLVFRSAPGAAVLNTVPATSTSWTFAAAFGSSVPIDNYTALTANFSALRTVAYGLKISTRQSATVASGFLHVALVPDIGDQSTWQFPTTVGMMEYCEAYRRIPIADLIQDEVLVAGKYYDQTAFQYHDLTASAQSYPGGQNSSMNGWGAIQIWIEAPASVVNALDIDCVYHYEGIVGKSSTTTLMKATPAAPHSPAEMAATSYVLDQVDSVVVTEEQYETSLWSTIKGCYNTGIQIATGLAPIVSAIAPQYGVPMMAATALLPKNI